MANTAFAATIFYDAQTYAIATGRYECYGVGAVCAPVATPIAEQDGDAVSGVSESAQTFSTGSRAIGMWEIDTESASGIFGVGALSFVRGSVDYGEIHAVGFASADSMTYGLGSYINPSIATAGAYATAGWFTDIRITSDTLPDGTPARALVGFELHSELLGYFTPTDRPCSASSNPWVRLNAGALSAGVDFFHNYCSGIDDMEATWIADVLVGSTYGAGASLLLKTSLGVGASDGFPNGLVATQAANASNSSYFILRMLTPGADYDAGGSRFLTEFPVHESTAPEPGTVALLGLGLAAWFGGRRPRSEELVDQDSR